MTSSRLKLFLFAVLLAPGGAGASALAHPQFEVLRAQSAHLSLRQRKQVQQIFSAAFISWQKGDFAAARDAFSRGLDIDPANAPANYYFADCLLRLGQKDMGLAYDERAIAFGQGTEIAKSAQIAINQAAIGVDDTAGLIPLTK